MRRKGRHDGKQRNFRYGLQRIFKGSIIISEIRTAKDDTSDVKDVAASNPASIYPPEPTVSKASPSSLQDA